MPTALITGASMGLGAEFARLAAQSGYDLILTARSEDRLNALATELQTAFSSSVQVVPLDLSRPGAATELHQAVQAAGKTVQVLINNAGFGLNGAFLEHALEAEQQLVTLNITALTELCHCFGQEMKARNSGYILNVASIAAFQAGPYLASYYASKAYVLSFSEALAHELKPHGVVVSALCPGPTATEFFQNAGMKGTSLARSPVLMSAQEVAEMGWKGLWQRRPVVIAGLLNQGLAFSTRFSPRRLNTFISGLLNRP